jgi:hypothetical protein
MKLACLSKYWCVKREISTRPLPFVDLTGLHKEIGDG